MYSRDRTTRKAVKPVPAQWSDWDWSAEHQQYYRSRLALTGDFEYEWCAPEAEVAEEAVRAQPSRSYPSTDDPSPEIPSQEKDYNEQWEGADAPMLLDRGRQETPRYFPQPDAPRDPSVSPSRPEGPGPDPPPPQPAKKHTSKTEPSPYNNKDEPFEAAQGFSTPALSSTAWEGYTTGGGLSRETEIQESVENTPRENLSVTIKKKNFAALASSGCHSFMSAGFASELRLEKKSGKSRYTDLSGTSYDCKERTTAIDILVGKKKEKAVEFYILPKKCPFQHSVILEKRLIPPVQSMKTSVSSISARPENPDSRTSGFPWSQSSHNLPSRHKRHDSNSDASATTDSTQSAAGMESSWSSLSSEPIGGGPWQPTALYTHKPYRGNSSLSTEQPSSVENLPCNDLQDSRYHSTPTPSSGANMLSSSSLGSSYGPPTTRTNYIPTSGYGTVIQPSHPGSQPTDPQSLTPTASLATDNDSYLAAKGQPQIHTDINYPGYG